MKTNVESLVKTNPNKKRWLISLMLVFCFSNSYAIESNAQGDAQGDAQKDNQSSSIYDSDLGEAIARTKGCKKEFGKSKNELSDECKKAIEQRSNSFMAGDMTVNKSSSCHLPGEDMLFTGIDKRQVLNCKGRNLFGNQVSEFAMKGLREDGLPSIKDIKENPTVACQTIWGKHSFVGASSPTPDYKVLCAYTEENECKNEKSLLSAANNLQDHDFGLVLVHFFSEVDTTTSNTTTANTNNGSTDKVDSTKDHRATLDFVFENGVSYQGLEYNAQNYAKATENSEKSNSTEGTTTPGLEQDENNGPSLKVRMFTGKSLTNKVNLEIYLCPDTIKELSNAGNLADETILNKGSECKEEFITTIVGGDSEYSSSSYSIKKRDGADENNFSITRSKIKQTADSNRFFTLTSCRTRFATELINESVRTCRSFQAIGALNNFEDQAEKFVSFDGKYHCNKTNAYTADYKKCKQMVNTYNAAAISENVGKMAEEVSLGDANVKAQEHLVDAENNRQVAAVEAQKSIIERKIIHEKAKVGLYSAHAAIFGGFLMSWRTPKNIHKKCGDSEQKKACCSFAAANYFDVVFKNYGVKRNLSHEFFFALGKAGAAGIMAHLYNKQKNQLVAIEDELSGLEAEDYSGLPNDLLVSQCQQNPTAPGCQNSDNLIHSDAIGQGNISFNGAGGVPIGAGAAIGDYDYGFGNDDSQANLSADDKDMLNSAIEERSDKSNNFLDNPSAAKWTKSNGGSGGGGSGAGGSASAPGLGRENKNKGGAKSRMVFGSKEARKKKGAGGFNYRGSGYSFNRSKDSNAFSKYLGKKGKKRGGISMGRELASDISGSSSEIFEQISNRYTKITSGNRLLEYVEE